MDSVSVALGANCCADSSTIASRGVIRESTYLRAAGPPSPKMSAGPVIHSDGAKSGIAPTADVTNCCGCDGSAYWKASEIKALASSNACAGTPRSRSRRRYEKRRESTVLHSASPFSVSENDIVTTAKARVSSSTPTSTDDARPSFFSNERSDPSALELRSCDSTYCGLDASHVSKSSTGKHHVAETERCSRTGTIRVAYGDGASGLPDTPPSGLRGGPSPSYLA
mmetsp:Transcript_8973/g.26414  ORF Transcript_8973/g.26414 Transcript_8973/m.26414 type:complete len:225 (-) Transcript_8973:161-835(-)